MLRKLNRAVKKILRLRTTPREDFHSNLYQRHNRKRLEHLASLGLGVQGATVLEVGAGIGDHTLFFLERRCKVLTTDARAENVEELQKRYPDVDVRQLDLDDPGRAGCAPLQRLLDVDLVLEVDPPLKVEAEDQPLAEDGGEPLG